MNTSNIRRLWVQTNACEGYSSPVSLHGHTLHSGESLDFLAILARDASILHWAMARYRRRYKRSHSSDLDLARRWWTPPVCVRRALALETAQIQRIGMRPMVSLTDHDNILGAASLRLLSDLRRNPVSIEWTVPFEETFFHPGNLHEFARSRLASTDTGS